MAETHKATLRSANAAIGNGGFEGFLGHCTDDTQRTFVGDRTLSDKDAVRAWMKQAYRQPPVFEVHRMIAAGDSLVALGEITLVYGSGSTTRHAYCDMWQFRDGRLAALQAFVVETQDAGRASGRTDGIDKP